MVKSSLRLVVHRRVLWFPRLALVFIHKCLGDTVIPAGIAGIQRPWMAMPKLAISFATRNCLVMSIHIPVLWIRYAL